MQPYTPPQTHVAPSENPDVDIASAATPLVAKAAGGLVLFAGVIFSLLGLQTLALINVYGVMKVAPWVLLACGVALFALGASIFRAQGWAPIATILVGAIAFVASAAWLVFSFANGLFGLFALGAPLLAVCSVAGGGISMGPCKRASDARARLQASGLGFGL